MGFFFIEMLLNGGLPLLSAIAHCPTVLLSYSLVPSTPRGKGVGDLCLAVALSCYASTAGKTPPIMLNIMLAIA